MFSDIKVLTKAEVQFPKVVIFDLDNTLYPYDESHEAGLNAVQVKTMKVLGINAENFIEAYEKARELVKQRVGKHASSHNRLLYMHCMLELLGLKTQIELAYNLEQTYWRAYLSQARLFPGVKEFLFNLRSRGILIAFLTNLVAHIQFRKFIHFGLVDFVDCLVTSEEVPFEKPCEDGFLLLKQKLNLTETDMCWMIGDHSEDDMMAAKKYLNATTFQKYHDGVKINLEHPYRPDVIFSDFNKLEAWIEKNVKNFNQ